MPKDYKLDRTAFKRQTAEEADDQLAYWLSHPPQERLRAAARLNAIAWNYPPDRPPKLQKDVFKARRRMRNEVFYQDFLEFIQALNNHEVEYLLVGGYAVILHGYARTTGNMNIWVNPSEKNYKKLVLAFREFGMPVFDMTEENFLDASMFDVFTFGTSPVSIDIMTRVKGLAFGEAFPKAKSVELDEGLSVRLIALEDLLKAKRASGRARDFDDIRHLKIAHEIHRPAQPARLLLGLL
ncbi:MAG: hypothetical protein KDD10_12095 [Phaeodactylibacter sp.]|nr:hypothetical protein [Phaeodactylibacter sp.]